MKTSSTVSSRCFRITVLLAGIAIPGSAGKAIDFELNDREKASRVCKRLPGFKSMNSGFKLEDSYIGHVNSMPPSLFVKMKSTQQSLISAIWWWNPMAKGGPNYSWDTVIGAHELATKKLSSLPWVSDWLQASADHELELHLLGNQIGEAEFNLNYFIKPLWAHANFQGVPMYSLLARFGRNSWAHLVISEDDNRVLLMSVNQPDSSRPHELDRTDVYWHPRGELNESSSKYAIIHPDGRIEILTYLPPTP